MATTASNRLEIFLLSIFKWVILAAMVLLIGASLWLVVRGALQIPAPATHIEATKPSALRPTTSDDFLQSFRERQASVPPGVPRAGGTSSLAQDAGEALYRVQAERLWGSVARYQNECGLASPLTKTDFDDSLRQTPLKRVLESRGTDFAASQEAFVKDTLANAETVKLCRAGTTGIFFSALEFHRSNWDLQAEQAKESALLERSRVNDLNEAEERRVREAQAAVYQSFLASAIAFGLFMCVSLILIFSRLESNLRGIHLIARPSHEMAAKRP